MPLAAKLSLSATLSALSVFLFLYFRGAARKQCMLAMLLSSCGDAFMVDDFINIGEFGTYVGAAFFIAAHIVYGRCFASLSKSEGFPLKNRGLLTGVAVTASSAVALAVLALAVPDEPMPVMLCLILVYVAVIGYHLCRNFSYSAAKKGPAYLLAFAVLIFYVSDLFIFLDMLKVTSALRDLVWYFYAPAQLLLVLFNSPLKRQNAKDVAPR